MEVTVRLPPALRPYAGGRSRVTLRLDAEHPSVRDLLDALDAAYPGVGRRVRDEQGDVRRHVNVYVGSDNIRDLAGRDTSLSAEREVVILPAVSGGAAPGRTA